MATRQSLFLGDLQHLSHEVVFGEQLHVMFHRSDRLVALRGLDQMIDQRFLKELLIGIEAHGLFARCNGVFEMPLPREGL